MDSHTDHPTLDTDESLHETLAAITGTGTELISVYVPHDSDIHRIRSTLRQEAADATNIKTKQTRTRVQRALTRIDSQLQSLDTVPDTGIALFAGVVDSATGTDELTEAIVPETPIETYRYHCDSSFLLDPLATLQDTRDVLGLVLVDVGEAHIGVLNGTAVQHLESLTSFVPPKHRQGGQSAPRFQRRRDEAIEEFYRDVGATATRLFDRYQDSFIGLTLGGPLLSRDTFADGSYLGHQFSDSILGVYSIDTVSKQALHALADASMQAISEHEYARQREFIDEFKTHLRENTAVYGHDAVAHAAELGAIDTLLVTPNATDDTLTDRVREYGGTVVPLDLDLEEAAQFNTVFGNYGATLRFEVTNQTPDATQR